MKRSEMIHKIEEYMLQHEGGVRINVRRLLNMLEKEGMQPPPIQVQEYLVPAQDGQAPLIPYTTTVNQWTSEE